MNMLQIKKSFSYAKRGLRYAYRHERNFRVELGIGACVLIGAAVFRLRLFEVVAVLFLVLFILLLELMNTAIEKLMDIMRPRLDPQVELAKDVMAAAVLLASLGASLIGALIFWPRVIETLLPFWYN